MSVIEGDIAPVRAGAVLERPQRMRAESFLRRIAPPPETVTPDPRRALGDMRLAVDLREQLARVLEPLGIALSDAVAKDRYGPLQRQYTLASGPHVQLALLQIPDWVLRDGSALGSIDETRYAFRGKTVRVVCPQLDATSAGFNTLRRDWREREQIDLMFVPWSHLEELAEGKQTIAEVMEVAGLGTTPATPTAIGPPRAAREVRVFVSYSHRDAQYVHERDDPSLLAYLKGTLEREGIVLWWDKRLEAGDLWDDEIKQQIAAADIALVLVSQAFLNSRYCIENEVAAFLAARKTKGLVIFPVILAPCDWKQHEWLQVTQFEPPGGTTVEPDYAERGKRDGLYLRILEQLRDKAKVVRANP